jgi:uncharacterized protein
MSLPSEWQELHRVLERGETPEKEVRQCCRARTSLGETMLHWYALEGDDDLLKQLVSLGFDTNTQNNSGRTPLMECAMIGMWDNARVLVDSGADATVLDQNGFSVFDWLRARQEAVPAWFRNLSEAPSWLRTT